jgi:hypothetical protein
MKYKIIGCLAAAVTLTVGCTKLDEKLRGDLNLEQAQQITDVTALLKGCYNGLTGYQTQDLIWALQTLSTDEGIPPTRGGDWDDNGVWRVIHNHTWTAENDRINGTFNNLLGVVFSTTNMLNFKPTAEQAAEAKFIRAFVMYTVLDVWNQVPFREPGENLLNAPKVLKGIEALNFIIAELNAVIPALPDNGSNKAYQANKNAARALLMKCYLNKGAITNRAAPTFDNADMAQVISLANTIITSNRYALKTDYFENFAPANGEDDKGEMIFSSQNVRGTSGGNCRFQYHCGSHYNQNPSGWNGFTTLSDFYDRFQAGDKRLGGARSFTASTGWTSGFQVGQQYKDNGVTKLKDRNGNDLIFTRAVKLIESGPTLEVTGIRVAKYLPDYNSTFGLPDQVENDYALIRYADVILMKAEAELRSAAPGTALTTINGLRSVRGAASLTAVTLNDVYDERGREFYWEGMRRPDMIRFGKFLAPFQEKPGTSDAKYLLYPIPSSALAVNPNLAQNPGY